MNPSGGACDSSSTTGEPKLTLVDAHAHRNRRAVWLRFETTPKESLATLSANVTAHGTA
jgi:hypothetical protein